MEVSPCELCGERDHALGAQLVIAQGDGTPAAGLGVVSQARARHGDDWTGSSWLHATSIAPGCGSRRWPRRLRVSRGRRLDQRMLIRPHRLRWRGDAAGRTGALEALACRGASRLQERLPDCFARRRAVRSRTAAWDNAVRSETGERPRWWWALRGSAGRPAGVVSSTAWTHVVWHCHRCSGCLVSMGCGSRRHRGHDRT